MPTKLFLNTVETETGKTLTKQKQKQSCDFSHDFEGKISVYAIIIMLKNKETKKRSVY